MDAWLSAARAGRLGRAVDVPDRKVIFERGDAARRACFLAQGNIEIVQRSPDGYGVVVKILVGPTLFGQTEALARMPEYLESVRVAGTCRYFAVQSEAFAALLREDGALAFECLVDMSRAFCVAARYEPARLFDTEALLANLCLAYAQITGESTRDGVRIGLRRSQADLADAIGAGERSVNRILATWKERGIVAKTRGHYLLRDVEALSTLAGELSGSLVHAPAGAGGGAAATGARR